MATASVGIMKCQKCGEIKTGNVYPIPNCAHTICKNCLPNSELSSTRTKKKCISDLSSLYDLKRHAISVESDESKGGSSSELVDPIHLSPGDCPVCQQRILCKNVTVKTHLPTYQDFEWIKHVQEQLDPKNCAECPEGEVQKAKFVCLKCARVLCQTCQEMHRKEGDSHVPLSFEDIDNLNMSNGVAFPIGVNRWFDPVNCVVHRNQQLCKFCAECAEPVCRLCRQHHVEQGHTLTDIEEGLEVMQKHIAENFDSLCLREKALEVEKDKFVRNEIDRDIADLNKTLEVVTSRLRQDFDSAILNLKQFKMAATDAISKQDVIRAEDQIENIRALKKCHEIMHRGKEKHVCSDEERIVRLYSFLKSNKKLLDGSATCLSSLQQDSARQVANPDVVYGNTLTKLVEIPKEGIIHVIPKVRAKGVRQHSIKDPAPRLVSGTIWPSEANGHVDIIVADANNRVMAFEFHSKGETSSIEFKWEKSKELSTTMRAMKELKAAWIAHDGRGATVVDLESNICEINMVTGERRKSISSQKKLPESAYYQGDPDLPAKHGYSLPKFLEKKGIVASQVIGFSEQDKFLVSGLHTASNRPIILVSSGDSVDLVTIRPQGTGPCRAWIDFEGIIYCANSDLNSVTCYSPDGSCGREILGPSDRLFRPVDIAVDRLYMYVTEEHGTIKIFERTPGSGCTKVNPVLTCS